MAVSAQDFPIIIMSEEDDQLDDVMNINYLKWYSPDAVAGDKLEACDDDDNVVLRAVADGPNWDKMYVIKHPINKLKVTDLDSGELHVIEEPPQSFNT